MKFNASAPLSRAKARRRGERPQRGFTLLELVIVLGVIIFAVVVLLLGVRGLKEQMNTSTTLRQVAQIKLNIAGLGSGDPTSLAKLKTATAIKLGAFPKESISGDMVSNPFGGQIFTIGLEKAMPPLLAGKAFAISYTKIPKTQCAALAGNFATMAEAVWVDTTTTEPTGVPEGSKMLKAPGSQGVIDLAAIAAQCSPSGPDVTIHALMVP
ncbi:type II secretion system protein [Mitsuaria sp. GD03876]|uniref:type II secretion system protein n=1 Tax=Mitsuaria sp. GD03876 TaxID=2975399 RepID=UPI00244A90FC|nr:type II secretion system protein [Mitsuaria sp. GD03876]MDH0866714.1 type II secretion system GspH family protein [Mitsuaria sp. GD03876]